MSASQCRKLGLTAAAIVFLGTVVYAENTPTEMRQRTVTITSPHDGERVGPTGVVKGHVQNPEMRVYVLVRPIQLQTWWVQPIPSPPNSDGTWRAFAYFGTEEAGKGKTFEAVAVLDQKDGFLHDGQELPMQAVRALLESHQHSDILSLVRE